MVFFIDLEKVYNMVPKNIRWLVLEKKSVTKGYKDAIKNMYDGGCGYY